MTKWCLTLFSQSDPVVLQVDDFEAISHHGVIIYDVANRCDQLDDHLGSVVTGSRLKTQQINENQAGVQHVYIECFQEAGNRIMWNHFILVFTENRQSNQKINNVSISKLIINPI